MTQPCYLEAKVTVMNFCLGFHWCLPLLLPLTRVPRPQKLMKSCRKAWNLGPGPLLLTQAGSFSRSLKPTSFIVYRVNTHSALMVRVRETTPFLVQSWPSQHARSPSGLGSIALVHPSVLYPLTSYVLLYLGPNGLR